MVILGIFTEEHCVDIGRWKVREISTSASPDSAVLEYPDAHFGDDGLVPKAT